MCREYLVGSCIYMLREGYTISQIAKELDVPIETIKKVVLINE